MNIGRLFTLLLGALLAIVIASPAQAELTSPIPSWVVAEGKRMLASRHKGAFVQDMLFLPAYPDTGEVIKISPASISEAAKFCDVDYLCGQGIMPIGTSSPRGYDKRHVNLIMSDFYNNLLGPPRANTLARGFMDYQIDEPYNGTIVGYQPGVLLIFYEFPSVRMEVTTRDTVYLKTKERTTETVREVPAYWVRPTVGFAGCWLDPQRVVTPSIGIAAGTRFGTWNVGAYAVEGQDFQPPNRGTSAYGIQFGDELGASVRLGYRSTWTEIRGDGHTTERSEGGEVGIGYGFPVCRLGIGLAILQYADLTDRGGEYRPAVTVNIDLGPLFQAE